MAYRKLTKSGSVLLDSIRFGAACVVFVVHLARIIPVLNRFAHLSHIAVCVFFVLSGFIIRMLVCSREMTMRTFLIDRGSRIYSVVFPALALAMICFVIGNHVHPHDPAIMREVNPHIPLQIATSLSFTGEIWGYEILPNFDSPFWSLNFECLYYILFALAFFRWKRRWGKLLFVLILIASGPSVIFLFPVWLAGCVLYDVYVWLDGKSYDWILASGLMFFISGLALVERHRLSYLLAVTDQEHRRAWLQHLLGPAMQDRFADSTGTVPWLVHVSTSYWIFGLFSSIGMLWGLILIDRFYPAIKPGIAAKIRWVAEGTFALYLLHLPLVLLSCTLLGAHPKFAVPLGMLIGMACIVASPCCDQLKKAMRGQLQRTFPAREQSA